jgi:hypothetical protein
MSHAPRAKQEHYGIARGAHQQRDVALGAAEKLVDVGSVC